jgi:superfamily II DNA/RNA helicase
MCFVDDIVKITTYIPSQRQTLMFSATMPEKIRSLAKKLLQNPKEISLAVSKPAAGVTQLAYLAYDTQKNKLITYLLKNKSHSSVIVFASTKQKVKDLERDLLRAHFKIAAIHSDLDQAEREDALRQFRNKQLQVLVATDILSRGIDIEDISLVINYDVPHDPEDYIHRIGRTARAEAKGMAITFINDFNQYKFGNIEQMIGYEIEKVPMPDFLGKGPDYNPSSRNKPFKQPSKFPNKRVFNTKGPRTNGPNNPSSESK